MMLIKCKSSVVDGRRLHECIFLPQFISPKRDWYASISLEFRSFSFGWLYDGRRCQAPRSPALQRDWSGHLGRDPQDFRAQAVPPFRLGPEATIAGIMLLCTFIRTKYG
jgi:hypothetical protein